jgi:hypothetical protein
VDVTDPTGTGTGAAVSVTTDVGAISGITVDSPGDGYLTKGIKKFQDSLPMPCNPGATGSGCPEVPAERRPGHGRQVRAAGRA